MNGPVAPPELAPEVIEGVRDWLARRPGHLTPHRGAGAFLAAG